MMSSPVAFRFVGPLWSLLTKPPQSHRDSLCPTDRLDTMRAAILIAALACALIAVSVEAVSSYTHIAAQQ